MKPSAWIFAFALALLLGSVASASAQVVVSGRFGRGWGCPPPRAYYGPRYDYAPAPAVVVAPPVVVYPAPYHYAPRPRAFGYGRGWRGGRRW